MPLQNTPLWHKNYFKMKTIKQQMKKKLFVLPICLKAGHKYSPFSLLYYRREKVSTEIGLYKQVLLE